MVLPLKLVSYNTYLVSRQFNQKRATFPECRAVQIQKFLKAYDLCFLQEVWGSGFPELTLSKTKASEIASVPPPTPVAILNATKPNWSNFSLPQGREPFLGQGVSGALAELVYTFYLNVVLQTGGLYDMARPAATRCVYRSKCTFTSSHSRSLKGVEATFWTDISAWENRYDLLVFNTHLDPSAVGTENRQLQIEEIVAFIRSTVQEIQRKPGFEQRHSWSKTGVLIVGDFNVKARSSEFESLLLVRGWIDFLAQADRNDMPAQHTYSLENSLVCHPEDCGRLDYIFGIPKIDAIDGQDLKFMPLRCLSGNIVRQPCGEEMSDHYPIAVELVPGMEIDL